MSFIVTARQAARDVCFERSSMLAAVDQALTLASSGMEGILIRDSSGRSRTLAELGGTPLEAGIAARLKTLAHGSRQPLR